MFIELLNNYVIPFVIIPDKVTLFVDIVIIPYIRIEASAIITLIKMDFVVCYNMSYEIYTDKLRK